VGAKINNQNYNDQAKQEEKNKNNVTKPHWACTVGAKINNQNYNDQVKQEEKNKNNVTKPHSEQGEYARRKT